jgi:hypothetical protein
VSYVELARFYTECAHRLYCELEHSPREDLGPLGGGVHRHSVSFDLQLCLPVWGLGCRWLLCLVAIAVAPVKAVCPGERAGLGCGGDPFDVAPTHEVADLGSGEDIFAEDLAPAAEGLLQVTIRLGSFVVG